MENEFQVCTFGKKNKNSEIVALFKLLYFTKFDSQACKSSV